MTLPEKLRSELQREFHFDYELITPHCIFHPLDYGRFLISIVPPIKQGIPELIINKSLKAKADLVVLVIPSDTSTEWFSRVFNLSGKGKVTLRPIQGRVKFTTEEGEVKRVPACVIIIDNTIEQLQQARA
jgi:hypothetical protein